MIENLKDLKNLLKLCRQNGVSEIKLGAVELKLGELPKQESSQVDDIEDDPLLDFPDGPLTPEELAFFAQGGQPKDNPYRQEQ